MNRKLLITICLSAISMVSISQIHDSISIKVLEAITIVGKKSSADIHQLPEVVGTNIYAGKKSALLVMDNVQGNIVSNTMRQVAAKIPGIFIWENESSGIQINISSRGLSPNRSWEFNVRQNGYDIAADPLGYPEAYYNPQLQSVQRIEIIRGHGALQYGSQLGGMVNYILKDGSHYSNKIHSETFLTSGSNGLVNLYQSVGGKTNKINYYAFVDHRQSNGWRENNRFNSNTGSASITFKLSEKLTLTTEFTRWASLSQQPGGLTDNRFETDPRSSLRARNWFALSWQTAAITSSWNISPLSKFNLKMFNILGDRESVGYFPTSGIIEPDVMDRTTGLYSNRVIDIDRYRNFGIEARGIHQFTIAGKSNTVSAGIRYFKGSTSRFRGGIGSALSNPDFKLITGAKWNSDIDYESGNTALFVENLINLSNRLMIIPGIRLEYLNAGASGYGSRMNNIPVALNPQFRERTFLLKGFGLEYVTSEATRIYFNSTQSYRPVQFADLTTPPTLDVIDPKLTDASGLNTDLGFRGKLKNGIIFDFSIFNLHYQNRIGTIKQQRNDGSFYNLRTNIGSSRSFGIEAFTELNLLNLRKKSSPIEIKFFTAAALMDARYKNLQVISVINNQLVETNLKNKKVEYAPEHIIRSGITGISGKFSTTIQMSSTGSVFTDANNTLKPTDNGQNGLIPSYRIIDWSFQYQLIKGGSVRGGVNNLFNEKYFTRRASGYPGPGVLPGDGRTFFITVGYALPNKN